jgi:hypothetical protein
LITLNDSQRHLHSWEKYLTVHTTNINTEKNIWMIKDWCTVWVSLEPQDEVFENIYRKVLHWRLVRRWEIGGDWGSKIVEYDTSKKLFCSCLNTGIVKGTVSRDFLPFVFFLQMVPLGPMIHGLKRLNIDSNSRSNSIWFDAENRLQNYAA